MCASALSGIGAAFASFWVPIVKTVLRTFAAKPSFCAAILKPAPLFTLGGVDDLLRAYHALSAADFGDEADKAEAAIDRTEQTGGIIRIALAGGASAKYSAPKESSQGAGSESAGLSSSPHPGPPP